MEPKSETALKGLGEQDIALSLRTAVRGCSALSDVSSDISLSY